MAEDKWMMDTGSKTIEGSATVVQGLEPWNGTSDDDGAGNFCAASPLENVQWAFLPPAEGQEEISDEDFVEAVREEVYRPGENVLLVVPSSTIPAGGTDTVTQVPEGMLEVPCRQMVSFIRSLSEIDENTLIKRHRGVYQNQKVKIMEYPATLLRDFVKVGEMAYLRYTFILPVLGYTIRDRLVMYPQMVKGDLTKVCATLEWKQRCQIMYQTSAGIAFLHSSVPAIREEIWHGSIKPENIYLDQNLNARIGDFSKAIELRKKSASPGDVANDDAKRKEGLKEDISSYVRVLRFLLKSSDATGCLPSLPEANKMVSCEKYWDMKIWKHVPQRTRKEIATWIVRCSTKLITAECLEINFKHLLVSYAIPLYNMPEDHSKHCIYCCVNIQDVDPVPVPNSEFCPDACPSRRFCRTCYQTSYRNTLYCPDHGPLKDKIPKKDVYAILLSGFETDQLKQDIFDRDVESMSNVITDPRIMGLSDGNIFQISHNSADKLKKLHDAVKYLKTKTVHTLIFYYSGHGKRGRYKSVDEDDDEDGYDKDDGEFYCLYNRDSDNKKENYEKDEKDYSDEDDDKDHVPFLLIGEEHTGITDRGLRKLLTPFTKTSILVIMDCCFAARYKVLPEIRDKEPHPPIFRVQFNGTGSSNFGQMSSRINSLFTCCLLRAMEGGFRCPPFLCDASKCKEGIYFQRSAAASGYISLADCHKFITRHMECWNADANFVTNGILDDVAIARYRDTPLGVFKYDIRGLKGMLKMYQLQDIPDDMSRQLWDEIGSMYGRSSRRHQLPKNLDFRCLKLVVPGSRGEREIQKKREVTRECCKGHFIQIRLRSTSQDLDQDRCVVCFYCDHNRFKEVLDKIQFCYKGFFTSPENTEMGQAAVIDIKLAEEPGLSELQSVYWDYERNDFMGLIVTSLTRAYEMARNNQNILGLRISITPNLATLDLEIKKQ